MNLFNLTDETLNTFLLMDSGKKIFPYVINMVVANHSNLSPETLGLAYIFPVLQAVLKDRHFNIRDKTCYIVLQQYMTHMLVALMLSMLLGKFEVSPLIFTLDKLHGVQALMNLTEFDRYKEEYNNFHNTDWKSQCFSRSSDFIDSEKGE